MEAAGGVRVSRFWLFYYTHRAPCRAVGLLLAALAAALLLADFAHADIFSDAVNLAVVNPLTDTVLAAASDNLASISVASVTNSFDDLFVGTGAYQIVTDVQQSLVTSLAYSVLAIVVLVQMVRIANRLDGAAAVPGVKEVIFLLIFFVIMKFVIDHSVDFCAGFYNGVTDFIKGNEALQYSTTVGVERSMTCDSLGISGFGGLVSAILFILPISIVSVVVGYFVVIARNVQLYIYAVFACVPLALLGCEETKQYGMGFIKNFVALCLTGIIIVLILILYPMLLQSVGNENGATGAGIWAPTLAVSALFIFAMTKSGSWARDILGG